MDLNCKSDTDKATKILKNRNSNKGENMKKVITIVLLVMFVAGTMTAYAAPKGASTTAMSKASDESVFNRVGDWFATRGKSDAEKTQILAQRKTKRAAERAQKEAAKQKKMMEKKAKEAKAKMNKQMKQTKKSFGK